MPRSQRQVLLLRGQFLHKRQQPFRKPNVLNGMSARTLVQATVKKHEVKSGSMMHDFLKAERKQEARSGDFQPFTFLSVASWQMSIGMILCSFHPPFQTCRPCLAFRSRRMKEMGNRVTFCFLLRNCYQVLKPPSQVYYVAQNFVHFTAQLQKEETLYSKQRSFLCQVDVFLFLYASSDHANPPILFPFAGTLAW